MKPSIIKSKDELPMFLSVMDMASLLGISRSSAYELAAEEGFPKLKLVPGRVIIPRDRLLEWLDEHTRNMAEREEVKGFSIGKQVKEVCRRRHPLLTSDGRADRTREISRALASFREMHGFYKGIPKSSVCAKN